MVTRPPLAASEALAGTTPLHGERTRPRVRFDAPRVELSRRRVAELTGVAIAALRLADEASASTREGVCSPEGTESFRLSKISKATRA